MDTSVKRGAIYYADLSPVVGSEVEIFGVHNRADKLADIAGTIPYELTCAVNKRVPRVFLKDGKAVGTELRMYL